MQKWIFAVVLFISSGLLYAQDMSKDYCYEASDATICIPPTSLKYPKNQAALKSHIDLSKKMFSNYVITKKHTKKKPHPTTDIETPASLACIYGLTPYVSGCPVATTTAVPNTGWGTIAIVDYGYNAYLDDDLKTFSQHYGLSECSIANGCFSIVYATSDGHRPVDTEDHGGEEHIDVEWAHAMAPNAKIVLVIGDLNQPLYEIVDKANEVLTAVGGGVMSISLATLEFPTEVDNDPHYQTPGIVYVASAADYGAPARYPSASPYVVSAGGTMIMRDANGNFVEEDVWNHGGGAGSGGPSLYEKRPRFQDSVQKIVGKQRGTPDIAFAAYQLSLYNTTPRSSCAGWCAANGTSFSAPALAGVINSANHRFSSSQQELTYIYSLAVKNFSSYWHDIVKGNNGYPALKGYDFCTGLGSPKGYEGK